jgi:beta-lactamase superfamily II metal-dependent hydrolase
MSQDFELPREKSVVYWPVGTGDATTLVLRPGELVAQIDIRHLEKAEDDDHPEWPIIDHLVRVLPKKESRPYLALFILTHPDRDHVQGFAELLRRVDIGEIWHTPKIFRDQRDQEALCDDAKAFRREVHRRREFICANPTTVGSGNRLRVIGHDDVLNEPVYLTIPSACKSKPGDKVSTVDGVDLSADFQAFIHAPFPDDQAKTRNNTSLALNVVIFDGGKAAQFLFFGDREYPTIKRIFDENDGEANADYLQWNVMLASHHCSKRVMFWEDDPEAGEVRKTDILDCFSKYAREGAVVVASAACDFSDEHGKNPPHAKARREYEGIVQSGGFICTHEYPMARSPQPIVFKIGGKGFEFADLRAVAPGPSGLAAAVDAARGGSQPPNVQVGFGSE